MLRCWKKKKKRKRARLQFKGRDYLGSVHLTWRHFTREHNGCCEVACPLSIVRFSQPHPVSPRSTSPPLLLEKTPSGVAEDLQPRFFVFTKHPTRGISAWPRPALPGRRDSTLPSNKRGNRRWSEACRETRHPKTERFPLLGLRK